MRNLLSSGFFRLWKSKLFWGCTALLFFQGVYEVWDSYTWLQYGERNLDDILFAYTTIISLFGAVFCSLFIGREYSDGTIRNKLMVGIRRSSVYLSNLVLSVCASVIMCLAYIIAAVVGSAIFLYPPTIGFVEIVRLLALSVLIIISLCALFTAVSLLCQNKAAASVICLLGIFIMFIASVIVIQSLSEEETHEAYIYVDGETNEYIQVPAGPNPAYVSGVRRTVYEFLKDFMPVSQGLQIEMNRIDHPLRITLYSLCLIFFTTLGGMLVFERKDLK